MSISRTDPPAENGPTIGRDPPAATEVCLFTQQASDALRQLRASLVELLPAIPKDVRRPTDLQRALKLDSTLSWQVFRLAESPDPMSIAALVPGPASMKKFLDAAKRQVPNDLVSSTAEAFARFEKIV